MSGYFLTTQGGKRKPRFQGVPFTATFGLPTEDFQRVLQGPVGQVFQDSKWLSRLPLQCYQCTPATLRSPGLRYCSGTVMGWKPREGKLSHTASRQLFQLYLSPEAGSLLNAASCLLRSRGSDSSSCQSTCLLEHLPRAVFTKWAGGSVSCRRRRALTLS